jgi:hypothetical protein
VIIAAAWCFSACPDALPSAHRIQLSGALESQSQHGLCECHPKTLRWMIYLKKLKVIT